MAILTQSFIAIVILAAVAGMAQAQVVNSEWNTGNGNWNVPANWFPNAVPNNGGGFTYNVQIGNRPVAVGAQVTFVPASGTSGTVSTLAISSGADLFTNGNQFNVLTQTTVDGVGTTIRVDPHATPGTPAFQTLNLALNNGGALSMSGGVATVSGSMQINTGSVLSGHGTINVGDFDLVAEQAFENSGLLQLQGDTFAPRTLTIHTNGLDTIDLDGDSETGVVDVDNAPANVNLDTMTLVIDGPLADAFGGGGTGILQIGQRDTVTFNQGFTMSGANVQMNGGNNVATLNGPGAITSIASSNFTITGNAVINNNMTFTGTGNTITVASGASLTLNGTVTIPDASALSMSGTSQLIIGGSTSIIEPAGDFRWDGGGAATTTVKGTGTLALNVGHIDVGVDVFNGTINLNDSGGLSVLVGGTSWAMAGTLNKNNAGTSNITGDRIIVTGNVNVNAGTLDTPAITLSPGANLTINGTMILGGGADFAGPASITGTGTLRMEAISTVSANTTIGTATFDWDGLTAGSLHTINPGVTFTINSTTFDTDGDMDDPLSLAGNGGQLNVNGVTNWTMAAALTTNPADIGTATIGGTARMTLAGAGASWTVTGNTTASTPVTFGSSATTIAAARTLRLAGGDNNLNTNVMAGGTIGGAGTLAANDARELRGFGNIGATIDFDGTARLRADGGTLTISGTIADVGVIGTADADGVLNVTNAWNNNVAAGVALLGGTVQGGMITNDSPNGIQGFGTVTSRVINNTQLLSFNGGTLIFETAADDNDWDGAASTGVLAASGVGTLEIRDNSFPSFGGAVNAVGGGTVFFNGFDTTFAVGSSISLTAATFKSSNTTGISSSVTVGAGNDSTIDVQVNRFLDFNSTSTTTLNGNLRLVTNNGTLHAGATFSGAGALNVAAGSSVGAENLANINVLVKNDGNFLVGGFNVGRVDVKDFQQSATGHLLSQLGGTGLNQFDRLVVNGAAQLAGALDVTLTGGFVPALGNTFNIVSATAGISGTFAVENMPSLSGGLAFDVVYSPTLVQLVVTNTLLGDFNSDGHVNATDIPVMMVALSDLNAYKSAQSLNNTQLVAIGDLDHSGAVTNSDLQGLLDLLKSGGGSTTAVPEPALLALIAPALVIGCAIQFARRRRA